MFLKTLTFTLVLLCSFTTVVKAQNTLIPIDYQVVDEYRHSTLESYMDVSTILEPSMYQEVATAIVDYETIKTGPIENGLYDPEAVKTAELAASLNAALFYKRRSGMEKTGRILTYIGVPLAIVGGIMVAGADELYYNCVNGDCEGDARGGFGVVALAAGLGLSGSGTALWIIGSKR